MLCSRLIGAGRDRSRMLRAGACWLDVCVAGYCTRLISRSHAASGSQTRTLDRTVIRQVLHWLAVALTIADQLQHLPPQRRADLDRDRLSTLLILALGCLLAGVHLEWMFALVGLLLLASRMTASQDRRAVAQRHYYRRLVVLTSVAELIVVIVLGAKRRSFRPAESVPSCRGDERSMHSMRFRRQHRLGADFLGQPRLQLGEFRRGLDRVVPRIGQRRSARRP